MRAVDHIIVFIFVVLFLSLMSKLAHAETLEDGLESTIKDNAIEWSQKHQTASLGHLWSNQCHSTKDCQPGEGCLTLWHVLKDKVGVCMN